MLSVTPDFRVFSRALQTPGAERPVISSPSTSNPWWIDASRKYSENELLEDGYLLGCPYSYRLQIKASDCASSKSVLLWVWDIIRLGLSTGCRDHAWNNTVVLRILTRTRASVCNGCRRKSAKEEIFQLLVISPSFSMLALAPSLVFAFHFLYCVPVG